VLISIIFPYLCRGKNRWTSHCTSLHGPWVRCVASLQDERNVLRLKFSKT